MERRRGVYFYVLLALVIYGLVSGAIALQTGRKCGDQGLDRHWVFVPPHWECTSSGPFVVN